MKDNTQAHAVSHPTDAPHLERLGVPVLDEILSVVPRTHHWRKGKNGPYFAKDRDTDERLPLKMAVINEALHGGQAPFGVAFLQPGSTVVRFATLDMDSHKGDVSWPEMQAHAKRLIEAGDKVGIRFIPFRSTGGSGIHLYAFWVEPQDARSVRVALDGVLQACGFKNGAGGVAAGEVEVFPKQDAVGEEGVGNMIVPAFFGKATGLKRSTLADISPQLQKVVYSDPVPAAPIVERAVVTVAPGSADTARIRSALMHIDPNEFDYNGWIRMVCAVSHGTNGSAEGHALIHEWSSQFSRYTVEETDKQWNWATPDKPDGITVNTLFAEARKRDWVDPTLGDGFYDITPEGLAREGATMDDIVAVREGFARDVASYDEAERAPILAAIPDAFVREFVAKEVDAYIEARRAAEKARASSRAAAQLTAQQLVDQFSGEERDHVVATWAARSAHLSRSEAEDVIKKVSEITKLGPRKLAAALNEARAADVKAKAKAAFEHKRAGRVVIEVEAGEVGTMSHQVEDAVVARAKPGGFLAFSGVPARVEVDTLPCTHLIDDGEVAPPPVLQLKPFNESSLRTTIERDAIFMSQGVQGRPRREDVPTNVIKNILVNPSPRVPRVNGLLSHPVVLPSGEIVTVDGLHAPTGLFLQGAGGYSGAT